MYSNALEAEFKKKRIEVGDRIKVVASSGDFYGLLMPRSETGDPAIVVLKLDNGYSIGLKPLTVELVDKNHVSSQIKKTEKKEKSATGDIAILGCGGTIASKIEYKTGAVSPSISPSELRASFPALEQWPIHSKQLFSLLSEDLNSHHWKILADSIEDEIKSNSSGVVVMHGTDTMTYTSAAISFMLQNLSVPVIFVGAQRSSDRPSSENEMNLLNSVFSATRDLGEVALCMHATTNDDYCHLHRGTRVRKMHTSRRDAFRSINSKPIAVADYKNNRFEALSEYKKRSVGPIIAKKSINDNVAMIYVHPNIKPELISKLDDYDGVVLLGTGLGHVPTNAFGDKTVKGIYKPVKELIDSGIPVVMSPQTISGRLCMRVYTNGRLLIDAGVIGDGADWTPETAYVKLCWVLGQTKDLKEVSKMMMTNYVGEISERSIVEDTFEALDK
ncbi:Glu-tRNA(Gln) amidotransferase subunit GatD [Candidatus Micrarchaeota archaeon]|nr:Glu-tRNA(Gln) amidotransferase subunit GatD [Candidatus Micrarchaeota archaeon]